MYREIIDKFMVDHHGDFSGGGWSIHRDKANAVGTVSNSNQGHMVVVIYKVKSCEKQNLNSL